MKILAVVVTHNRRILLEHCIQHLNTQKRLPDEVLVINNGSTDETENYLIANNIKHITQENLGSAGGWSTGIEYALRKNFDACWLMDDDGYPHQDSLEILEKNLDSKVSCVSSVVLKEDKKNEFVFPMPYLNKYGNPTLKPFKRKIHTLEEMESINLKPSYPFVHLFNGALINMSFIEKAGNINKNFFMFGDEVDYFYRLRKVGDVKSMLHAHHYHPDVTKRPYSDIKVYYLIKNTIILHKRYFDKPILRNLILIPVVLVRVLFRNGIVYFLKYIFSKKLLMPKSVLRGFQGNIGKDHEH